MSPSLSLPSLQLGFRDTSNTSPSYRKESTPGSESGGGGPGSLSASRGERAVPPVPQTATPEGSGSEGESQGSSVSYPPPPAPVTSSPVHNTQHADTAHSESHRDMGRLAAEEEGDSEEEQRQMTQHSSDGQGPSNETHGTYLEALTGSTYSKPLSTFYFLSFFFSCCAEY